jgi:hypothetical protein
MDDQGYSKVATASPKYVCNGIVYKYYVALVEEVLRFVNHRAHKAQYCILTIANSI